MKVIVASTNPVKIEVARLAFTKVFPNDAIEIISVKSDSGLSDQPFDDETFLGAQNRLKYIQNTNPDADYWISQEGGLHNEGLRMFNRAWIIVCDKEGTIGKSSTVNYYIPTQMADLIRNGDELGTANDIFFNTQNSKQKGGAVACLTDGLIRRTEYYEHSAIIALSQVVHKEWYK